MHGKRLPAAVQGGPRKYSDLAIVTTLTLRTVFHLPLRQAEGFVASLMPDGVYVTGADGTPSFVRAPQLTDDEVQRVVRLLQRRGVLEEGNVDPLWQDEPLLATITAASVQGQIATGERAGLRVRRRPAVLCLAGVLTACRHTC